MELTVHSNAYPWNLTYCWVWSMLRPNVYLCHLGYHQFSRAVHGVSLCQIYWTKLRLRLNGYLWHLLQRFFPLQAQNVSYLSRNHATTAQSAKCARWSKQLLHPWLRLTMRGPTNDLNRKGLQRFLHIWLEPAQTSRRYRYQSDQISWR